jgi:hypothetical protein
MIVKDQEVRLILKYRMNRIARVAEFNKLRATSAKIESIQNSLDFASLREQCNFASPSYATQL